MTDDDDISPYSEARQRRIKITAWVVIAALVVTGGGATAIALFLG